jgi:hypothetical protein
MRHPARRGCSTARPDGSCRPAITDQCVLLSAVCQRLSTPRTTVRWRSDDLRTLSAAREPRSELGFRGAPLRNRTVDLLLTMNRLRVQLVQVRALDQPEHEHTLALTSSGWAFTSTICHSICHSLRSCSNELMVTETTLRKWERSKAYTSTGVTVSGSAYCFKSFYARVPGPRTAARRPDVRGDPGPS